MTKLADVFRRELWTAEDINMSSEVTSLLNSRILVSDPKITEKVRAMDSGTTILVPFVQEDLYSEPSIMDDSNDEIVADKINKVQGKAYVGFYAKAWGEMDIVREIGSGLTTADTALSLLGRYWAKDLKNRMIATVVGAIADNKANHASDNVLTDAATEFNYPLVVDTIAKAGEQMTNFVAIGLHSSTYAKILKNDAASVTTIKDSDLGTDVQYYNGLEIIVDDAFPVDGTAGTVTTVFFKPGAFLYANVDVEVPVDSDTSKLTGKGGGSTTIITRNGKLLSLNGYSFTGASVASVSPSLAELSDPTNWERLIDAKQAPFVALESKI